MKFKREIATAILRDLLTTKSVVNAVDGIAADEFVFHAYMLRDAGLIKAQLEPNLEIYSAIRITWEGYTRLGDFDDGLAKEFDPKNFVRNFPRS